MIFSSLTFLLIFLPLLIAIYYIIPAKCNKSRKYILLCFSIFFYAAGEPIFIFLIFGCILFTWLLSAKIAEKSRSHFIFAIVINLLPLLFFKYFRFIAENIIIITGTTAIHIPELSFPIGISFYTFQIIAYVVDLYHKNVERQENIAFFALYIMFFPQLIAGPIVRYQEVQDSIENNRSSWEKVQYGVKRFIVGLSKKVVVANQVGYIAMKIMSYPLQSVSTKLLWLAVISFTLQIYFDFSGYSDMAIGLGGIFGFSFPENFKRPYMSTSVSDFWRRWHITLGFFFRDYVYIPLGGNRVNTGHWVANIVLVWILTGFWHGAEWNFVVWGGYYAVLLVLEKGMNTFFEKLCIKMPEWIRWFFTMFLVALGWAIFMADGYKMIDLGSFLGRLFHSTQLKNKVTITSMNIFGYLPYVALGLLISFPTGMIIGRIANKLNRVQNKIYAVLHDVILIGMLILCIIYIIGGSYNPFIYYKF